MLGRSFSESDPKPTSRNAKILAANSAKMDVESQLADKAGAMLRH
jgi:hypothetical protein